MEESHYPQPKAFIGAVYPLLGAYFYNELIQAIDDSRIDIYSVQYQWKWNTHERHGKVQRLGSAIARARTRGVAVHVLLNLEAPKANISKINSVTADHLNKLGCDVKLCRVSGLLHTKLWTFDREIVFIGSHNISGRSLGVNEEVSVKIQSVEMNAYMRKYYDQLKGLL